QKQDACSVIPKIAESIRASTASGDIADTPVPAPLRALFIDRLAAVIVSDLLPPIPAVDYGVPRDKLIEHAVWFALRGLGMKDESIRRHYNPKALTLLAA